MYEKQVARGAALLDRAAPGWAEQINLDRLAMQTCDRCILGQIYGDYALGFRAAIAGEDSQTLFSPADHGFMLRLADDEYDSPILNDLLDIRFRALADAWRAEIAKRAGQAGAGA